MMLCMDENGRVYQASVDHSNGQGVERMADTVSDFGVNSLQNPYVATTRDANREAKMLQSVQVIEDQNLAAQKQKNNHNKKQAFIRAEQELEMSRSQNNELMTEAVLAGMGSPDFDQLSIVDDQYGPRHQAVLQGLGMVPTMGDKPYLRSVDFSNPMEIEQAALIKMATNEVVTQKLSQQKFQDAGKDIENLPGSYKDQEAQIMLQGEGEIFFDNEDDAKTYNKLSRDQQEKFLMEKQAYDQELEKSYGVDTKPAMTTKNKVMTAAAILAALYFVS